MPKFYGTFKKSDTRHKGFVQPVQADNLMSAMIAMKKVHPKFDQMYKEKEFREKCKDKYLKELQEIEG